MKTNDDALFTLVETEQDFVKETALKLSKLHAESLNSSGNKFETIIMNLTDNTANMFTTKHRLQLTHLPKDLLFVSSCYRHLDSLVLHKLQQQLMTPVARYETHILLNGS